MTRQLELVKLLYEEKNFQPSEYFSKKLSISTKTLYGELTSLNEKFQALGIKANITKLPRKGIMFSCESDDFDKIIHFLNANNHHSFFNDKAIRLSPYYRKLDILKRNILNAEKTSLDKLSKKYLVSKTSIIKDLNEINERLNKDKVKLEVNKNQIIISGDEVQIQTAIKNFLLFYLDKKDDEYINELLNRVFADNLFAKIKKLFLNHILRNQSCSEHYLLSLLLSLTIQVKRLSLGLTIKADNDFLFNHIRYLQSFVLASNFIQPMCEVYNVSYSSNDINYLSKIFFTHRLVDEDSNKSNEKSYSAIIKEIIKKVSEIEDVDLLEDELLYRSLFNHFPAMITRLQKNIEIINPILDEVKKEYSTLFSVLWYALSNLEMNLNIHFNDHEISFLLIHFQVALDRIANANNIVLLYPKGQSSFSLLLNKIKQILPARDNLEVRTLEQLDLSGLDNVNLVISTVEAKLTEDIPVVRISPLVTKSDYKKITESYIKYVWNKSITSISPKDSTLFHYLNSGRCYFNSKVKSKDVALKFLLDELEKDRLVKKEYKNSVLQRENLGNTAIEGGIALPHGSPQFVNKSSISIMTLSSPIKWGVIDINIIILVALSERDSKIINSLYTELYGLISNEAFIQAVNLCKKSDDFISVLNNNFKR